MKRSNKKNKVKLKSISKNKFIFIIWIKKLMEFQHQISLLKILYI